ncbi:SDR family oxidoreductase [Halomonas sabkhae]|uniref:SDR family oxidoreductase n=1 Tax=Halomonas sabkhae TaxID=626223 RepID=UPI0025B603CC|nr:SDR family oxidoreductase [Halomonas sabkhae]MDN3526278.1 SDR family oxidoreductase [Halomonas sabkhae]
MGRLSNKRIMITGAAHGIGRAIAEACVREGAAVLLYDREAEALGQLADALRDHGHDVLAELGDITDRQALEAAVSRAREAWGPLTTLVNNAGVNVFHAPLQMPDAAWEQCLRVDLEGAWTCSRTVLPDMLANGDGSIINIASTHAFSIIPGCFPYPVAKHGLIGMTRALGVEYAGQGVRVNAIAPGYIATPAVEAHWRSFEDPVGAKARIEAILPPGRLGRPEEVAMSVVFLASDEAPFINATCLTIDGGRSVVYHDA